MLQPMESQRVRDNSVTEQQQSFIIHDRHLGVMGMTAVSRYFPDQESDSVDWGYGSGICFCNNSPGDFDAVVHGSQ